MSRLILLCIIFVLEFTNGIVHGNPIFDNNAEVEAKTNTPIIGVLAQEISWHLDQKWPGVYESYIAASYVKFVEGGGARAVPIW